MPTSSTSTNNTYSVIIFFMMMITFFACFLIFVLIFFQDGGRIFRFHSMSTKQRQLRQQEIVGLWLSKICSATFAMKIAYLWKLRQYIQLWKMFTHQNVKTAYDSHQSRHSWQTSKRIFLSIKVYWPHILCGQIFCIEVGIWYVKQRWANVSNIRWHNVDLM